MMDNTNTDPSPSERTSDGVSFSDYEGHYMNEADDCHDDGVNHDKYYLEKFRRALNECDHSAQEWLQHDLIEVVLDWMQYHPSRNLALRLHSKEHYVAQTFEYFWQTSLHYQKFEFKTLADVLRYLRVSLNSVILDTLRSYSRPGERPLVKSVVARGVHSNEGESSHEVWNTVQEKLSDARELRLAYLLFHCALKPGEIVHRCPQEFSDVSEISRIRRNIIELLCN
jgi:hypothetical protein